ncbi:MAG: lipopolysaccharide heptosyltransferase I [Desulfarculus sp.]|nr:lipopolysaccharide heptosyltransferase I [Desulfarculus sp.]
MKVLIVKLSALGDVVQSLPVAMAIRRHDPSARIDWLVERPSAGLLQGHPALDNVLVSPRHELQEDAVAALPEVGTFMGRLRSVRYDVVLELQGLIKSAIFARLVRGDRKIGFRGGKEPLAALALNEPLPAYDPERHALERYLDILEPLGVLRPARPEFGLQPTEGQLAQARELLGPWGRERPLVVLHPVAKWESKLWPLAHWVDLARRLREMGLDLALSGAPADRAITGAIAQEAGGGVLDLAGRTGLKDLVAVLSLARLVVCTDTGVMHLAAALDRPVVALFGPTSPGRTGPWGAGHAVLRLGLSCSPCFKRQCPEPRCLSELTPAMAAQAVADQLTRGGGMIAPPDAERVD